MKEIAQGALFAGLILWSIVMVVGLGSFFAVLLALMSAL